VGSIPTRSIGFSCQQYLAFHTAPLAAKGLSPFSSQLLEFLPRGPSAVLLEEGGDVLFFAPALLVDRLPLCVLRQR
jgi:hypothetical protein